MKKDWTTTKLIAAGSLGVLTVALKLFGAGIAAVTGVVGSGGVINGFVTPAMAVICLFVVNQLGAGTVMFTIRGILTLPLPLTGPPGWLVKVLIEFIGGVVVDILYHLLKGNKQIASIIIGMVIMLYIGLATFGLGRILHVTGLEELATLVFSPMGISASAVLGSIGGYLGYLIYQRIKNTAVLKRIQQ